MSETKMYDCHVHGTQVGDHCEKCTVKAFIPAPAEVAKRQEVPLAELEKKITALRGAYDHASQALHDRGIEVLSLTERLRLVETARDEAEARYSACYAELTKVQDERKALREENERLNVSLAGISSTAFGNTKEARECVEKREWAFTQTMKDVLDLYDKYESARKQLSEMRAQEFKGATVHTYGHHVSPDVEQCQANAAKEPEGERLRNEFEAWLEKNKIVGMMMDTKNHFVQIDIAKLPPRLKSVLTYWGAITVVDE